MLTEEEKQKIIEEYEFREKLAEEKEKEKKSKLTAGGVICLIFIAIVTWWIVDTIVRPPTTNYTVHEQGYIMIQPIK